MIVTRVGGRINASYFQFYAIRGDAEWASTRMTDEGYARRLEEVDGFVYFGTNRWGGDAIVDLEVHDVRPPEPDASYQHVAETSVGGAGDLEIVDWDGPDADSIVAPVPDGPLRLRALWIGLSPDEHDGCPDLATERHVLQVWRTPPAPPQVLRCYPPWATRQG